MKKLFLCILSVILITPSAHAGTGLSAKDYNLMTTSNITFYTPIDCIPSSTASGNLTTSDEKASAIAGILQSHGYSDIAIAAMLGNLANESGGFNPLSLEKSYASNAEITVDDSFVAWDKTKNKKTYLGGFGIVQWTTDGRVQSLQNYADQQGLPVASFEAQVGFMVQELAGSFKIPSSRINALTLEEATHLLWSKYFIPNDSFIRYADNSIYRFTLEEAQSIKSYTDRLASAQGYLGIESSGILSDICGTGGNLSGLAGNIAATAIAFAWPQCSGSGSGSLNCASGHKNGKAVKGKHANASYDGPTELYGQNSVGSNTADCAIFVASVIHYAGVDPNFPKGSTAAILPYLLNDSKQSNGTWVEVTGLTSTSQVQAGDIIIWRGNSSGHIMIALGGGLMADASVSAKRNGDISAMYSNFYQKDYGNSGHVFRLR